MRNFLYLFFILLSACSQNNPTPSSPQMPILNLPQKPLWQTVDLDKLLKPRDISEFTYTVTEIGDKKLYQDTSNTDQYIFSEGMKSEGFLEAYAGTLYHFLLGKHSSFTQFVFDTSSGTNTIIGASLYEATYEDSYKYHDVNKTPFLPPGSGLGSIIAASMLLGERDLKGLASVNSNLGIVTKNGQSYYFKIDHSDSFHFDSNLADLKNLQSNMPYLENIGFKFISMPGYPDKDLRLSKAYLDEIAQAAKYLAAIPQSEIIKVLDFCEAQLNKLAVYPKNVDLIGTHPTYKSAILERFDILRNALK